MISFRKNLCTSNKLDERPETVKKKKDQKAIKKSRVEKDKL